MTREEAEMMVLDLVDAVRSHERAQRFEAKHRRQNYEEMRDKVIAALVETQG